MIACLRSPLGGLVARPWFDRAALAFLSGWFFPLSRLWAAARAAEGSVERYAAELPAPLSPRLERALAARLARFEQARARVQESERAWEEAFFGPAAAAPEALTAAERRRLFDRHAYNALRRIFAPFAAHGRARPFRWRIPEPAAVEALYGGLLAEPARAFAPPDPMPPVRASHAFPAAPGRRDYWLRFPSPSARMNDEVTARVYEPAGVADPPTLLFGHGIGVEFDHWRGVADEIEALVAMGLQGGASGSALAWPAGPPGALRRRAVRRHGALRGARPLHGGGPRMGGADRLVPAGGPGAGRHRRQQPRRDDGADRLRPGAPLAGAPPARRDDPGHALRAHRGGDAGGADAGLERRRFTPLATMAVGGGDGPWRARALHAAPRRRWTTRRSRRRWPVSPERIVSVLGAYDDVTPSSPWGARALIEPLDGALSPPAGNRVGTRRRNQGWAPAFAGATKRGLAPSGHFSVPTSIRGPCCATAPPLVRFREVMAGLA